MQSGVEARVPFLDHKLVEFVLTIPEVLLNTDYSGKPLLKKVAKNYISSDIIDRQKQGFRAPVGEWIKKDIDKNDKKVEAFQELFAPLTDIPLTEPLEEEIIEEVVSPVKEEVIVEKKVTQPKKPKTIKKAMVSIDEQKFMTSFLDKISKLPPEEKPVDVSEQSFPNSIKDSLLTPDQTSLQRKVAQPEDSLTRLRKEFEQFRTVMQRNLEAKENAFSGYGSGEVNLRKLDDVDDSAKQNGFALKYNSRTKQSAIENISRVSKPGLRKYVGFDNLPRVINGLGVAILSTSKGIITDTEARKLKIGG